MKASPKLARFDYEFVRLCTWVNRNPSDFFYFELSEDVS